MSDPFFELQMRRIVDADEDERIRAVDAFRFYSHVPAFDAVASCLDDKEPAVRRKACLALKKLDATGKLRTSQQARCTQGLVARLTDDHHTVREVARWALWGVGVKSIVCTLGGPEAPPIGAATVRVDWVPKRYFSVLIPSRSWMQASGRSNASATRFGRIPLCPRDAVE